MQNLSSEILLYGGIAAMAAAVMLSVISGIILFFKGKTLKKKLEEEYGKPR